MSRTTHLPFRFIRILVALVLGAAGLMAEPRQAWGAATATFTVNHTNDVPDLNPGDGHCDGQPTAGDQCSLRAAVEEANALAGDDTITLPAGSYTIVLLIPVTSNIILQGAGQAQTTITSDNTSGQTVFRVASNGNLAVHDIRFYSCHRAFLNEGDLSVYDILFEYCQPSGNDSYGVNGGAILNTMTGALGLTNATFNHNATTGTGCGGAIYNAGQLYAELAVFAQNQAYQGGALCLEQSSQNTVLKFSHVRANQAVTQGGGIYATGNATGDHRQLWFSNIQGNSAQTGGGIYLETSWMNILQSSVVSNTASAEGGGFYGAATSEVYVTNATFSANTSGTSGGGLYLAGAAYLANATVTNNTADEDGNNNGNGGGLAAGGGANVHFKNSLLADNSDASQGTFATISHDCLGALTADGNVLVGIGNHATLCTVHGSLDGSRVGSQASPIDPRLGSLEASPNDYTRLHPLLADSPAVDGGNLSGCADYFGAPLTQDQRGEPRFAGLACDIGAYESGFAPVMPVLSIGNASVVEGDTGVVTATFMLSLSAEANWIISATASTQNGTALAGLDYTAALQTLVFQPGETIHAFNVRVLGDTSVEGNETFL